MSSDWPRVDYHSHICREPLPAMLAAARGVGLREYGVSEHVFQMTEGHAALPDLALEGGLCDRAAYVSSVREAAAASPDLAIRLGLEVDYEPARHDAIMALTRGVEWDYLIGSVHLIDDTDIFRPAELDAAAGVRLWRRYYEVIAEAIETGDYDIISHPLRNAEHNPHIPADLDRLLEEVAAFARLHGVALELNGYDTLTWPHLVERLANACGAAGCSVSLGSDAHHAKDVASGLQQASAYAAAARVPGVLSFQKRERRLLPL